ncbi:uncharacterized protein LOC135820146 [Sycon ciliatum]|uniref:uncharacterized protein LOC135820146 n=1 Tax=Sycon ciliatum TaxID=27933 RepID=UPI0031F60E8A
MFAAYLARSVQPSTIRVDLSPVRNLHLEAGHADPLGDTWLLGRVLKGIDRCHGNSATRPRLPITVHMVHQLVDACHRCTTLNDSDKRLYVAAMLSAFYGFLRCAEFTSIVRRRDVKFEQGAALIFLRTSKTDPSGRGVTITIGPASPPYCAVSALLQYLLGTRSSASPDRPLFVLSNGQPLSRPAFTATVRMLLTSCGFDSALYAGHSFRIGAATTAALAGLPDSVIREAGRWKSDACLRYIRTPTAAKARVAAAMASAPDIKF